MRISFAPRPLQCLVFNVFIAFCVVVYHIGALLCISLMTNELNMFSYVYWLFVQVVLWSVYSILYLFLLYCWLLFLIVCMNSLYFWHANPLLQVFIARTFSCSVACIFTSLMVYFEEQKFLILIKLSLLIWLPLQRSFSAPLGSICLP